MPRLPQPGSDNGTWGNILNDYLSQALKPDGSLKDNSVTNSTIAPNAVTATEIQTGSVNLAKLSTTGTASDTTFLRGDGTWATPAGDGGGDMVLASVQTVTGAKTFNAGTLLDKGSTVFNVRAYGAVGNGSTDDAAAITSAIAAANGAGGGTVFFPGGTYIINSVINLATNVRLLGAGTGTAVIKASNTYSAGEMLHDPVGGVSHVRIEAITFDVNGKTTDAIWCLRTATRQVRVIGCEFIGLTATFTPYVGVEDGADFVVEGCKFSGPSQTSVRAAAAYRSSHVRFNNNMFDGFHTDVYWEQVSNSSLTDNSVTNFGWSSFRLVSSSYVTVTGNTFDTTWYPGGPADSAMAVSAQISGDHLNVSGNVSNDGEFSFYGTTDSVIANNVVNNSFAAGIEINDNANAGGTTIGAQRVSAVGNKVTGSQFGSGIFVAGTDISVMGNTVTGCDGNGIQVCSSSQDLQSVRVSVIGNICLNNSSNGVNVSNSWDPVGADYVTVAHNICTDTQGTKTQGYGLNIGKSTTMNVQAWGNRFEGNLTGTMNDASGSLVHGVSTSDTQTLTNKRVTPRVSTTASSATPTINTDTVDTFGLTAQTVDITSFTANLTGAPTNGQRLWIYVVGTATRAITWGSSFENGVVTLPATTTGTQRLDVGFMWNSATSKWRCMTSGSA